MELDALKNSWNTISVDVDRTEFDLIAATKKEMISPLDNLKKRAQKQVKILPILFAFLMVVASQVPHTNESFLIWMALAILPLTTIYYYFNLKLINELESYNGTVKHNIQIKIKKLVSSNRIYLMVTRIAFAILMITAEVFIRYGKSEMIPGLEKMIGIIFPLRVLIYLGIFGIHYLLSRYTFNFYFGKHITKLKSILQDMQ